jgi:hypothetical protein
MILEHGHQLQHQDIDVGAKYRRKTYLGCIKTAVRRQFNQNRAVSGTELNDTVEFPPRAGMNYDLLAFARFIPLAPGKYSAGVCSFEAFEQFGCKFSGSDYQDSDGWTTLNISQSVSPVSAKYKGICAPPFRKGRRFSSNKRKVHSFRFLIPGMFA